MNYNNDIIEYFVATIFGTLFVELKKPTFGKFKQTDTQINF